jgi:hypothetical protein
MSSLRKRNKRKTLTSKKQKHTRKNGKRKQRRFQKHLHSKKYRGGKGDFDLDPDMTDERLKGIQSWLPLYKGYAWVKKSVLNGGFYFNRRQIMIVAVKYGLNETPALFIIKCISDVKCSQEADRLALETLDEKKTRLALETLDEKKTRLALETLDEKRTRLAKLKIHQITRFTSNPDGSFDYISKEEENTKEGTYTIKLEQAPDDDLDDDDNFPLSSRPWRINAPSRLKDLMNARVATNNLKLLATTCERDGVNATVAFIFSQLNDPIGLQRSYNKINNT